MDIQSRGAAPTKKLCARSAVLPDTTKTRAHLRYPNACTAKMSISLETELAVAICMNKRSLMLLNMRRCQSSEPSKSYPPTLITQEVQLPDLTLKCFQRSLIANSTRLISEKSPPFYWKNVLSRLLDRSPEQSAQETSPLS